MEVNNHSIVKATDLAEIHFPLNHENRDGNDTPDTPPPPVEAQSEWRFVLPHLSGDIVTSSQLITEAVPRGIQHDATYTTQGLGSQELHLRAKGTCLSEVPLFTHKKTRWKGGYVTYLADPRYTFWQLAILRICVRLLDTRRMAHVPFLRADRLTTPLTLSDLSSCNLKLTGW